MTRTVRGSSSSLVCAVHISHHLMCHHHAFMLCVWFSTTSLLSSSCCLSSIFSYRPVFLPGHQLLLPRCGGQIPCALPLMRTLAPLPSTTLSQVTSPTTITSRKPLNRTSRNPPAKTGPWTHMTLSTMTTPSAWRSLHHCSPRSDKMQRAVDEFITLMTKVCRPVSRRLSVIERGDRCGTVWLTDLSNVGENPRSSLDNEQIRILLERQREQILADCQAEIWKHEFQADYDRRSIQKLSEVYQSSKRRNFSCSSRRRTTSTRSTTSSWTVIRTKSGSSWSSWEESQWDGRIEEISRVYIRCKFEEKIRRRSRYYPWTHRQDSGITEWT